MDKMCRQENLVEGDPVKASCEFRVPVGGDAIWYHEPEETTGEIPGRDEWNLYLSGFSIRVRIIELTDDNDIPTGYYTALSYDNTGEFIDLGLEIEDEDVVFGSVVQAMNYVMDKVFEGATYRQVTPEQIDKFLKAEKEAEK